MTSDGADARPTGAGVRAGRTGRRRRAGLGPDFTLLWSAATVSSVGDGVHATALPLLAAALTTDPTLVGLATSIDALPWLLVGLVSGALVDRWPRLRLMWIVDLGRCALVAALAVAVAVGAADIPLLLAVGFLLGVGHTLFDTASQATVPTLVDRTAGRLERANGRLEASRTVADAFVGPPLGGFLYAAAAGLPFAVDAMSFAAGALAVRGIARRRYRRQGSGPQPPSPARPAPERSLRADIGEGLTWLFRHRLMRTLALVVGLTNLSFTAGTAIFVLFARQRLGLGPVGYGVLLTALAAGALLGSVVVGRLSGLAGPSGTLATGLGLLALSRIGLAFTTEPVLAGAALLLAGVGLSAFNVVGVSLRQRLVPDPLVGRVVSAFRMLGMGAVPLGGALGGLLAAVTDIRVPYVVGGALIAAAAVTVLAVLDNRAIAEAERQALAGGSAGTGSARTGEPGDQRPGDDHR